MDFFEMLEDVRQHVRQGHVVDSNDSPETRSLGYRIMGGTLDGKEWSVSITDLRKAKVLAQGNDGQLATLAAFQTPDGRKRLVDPVLIAFQGVIGRFSRSVSTSPYLSRQGVHSTMAENLAERLYGKLDCESWILASISLQPVSRSCLAEDWAEFLGSRVPRGSPEDAERGAEGVIDRLLAAGRLKLCTTGAQEMLVAL